MVRNHKNRNVRDRILKGGRLAIKRLIAREKKNNSQGDDPHPEEEKTSLKDVP